MTEDEFDQFYQQFSKRWNKAHDSERDQLLLSLISDYRDSWEHRKYTDRLENIVGKLLEPLKGRITFRHRDLQGTFVVKMTDKESTIEVIAKPRYYRPVEVDGVPTDTQQDTTGLSSIFDKLRQWTDNLSKKEDE